MARLELEQGIDVLLLETGDALLLEGVPVVVTPSTLAQALTFYIPTLDFDIVATPTTLALTLTTHIPTLDFDIVVTPTNIIARLELEQGTDVLLLETGDALLFEYSETSDLILTTYIPTLDFDIVVTPSTLAQAITTYAPSLISDIVLTPGSIIARLELEQGTDVLLLETGDALELEYSGALTLTLTTYIPTLGSGAGITPTTLAFATTTYSPVLRLDIPPQRGPITKFKLSDYTTRDKYKMPARR